MIQLKAKILDIIFTKGSEFVVPFNQAIDYLKEQGYFEKLDNKCIKSFQSNKVKLPLSIPRFPRSHRPIFAKIPLWLLVVVLLLIFGYWKSISDDSLLIILLAVIRGIGITLFVAFIAFVCSALSGLLLGILRSSRIYIFSQMAFFYIEIIRGLPIIVILYYIAFVLSPKLIVIFNICLYPLIQFNIIEALTIRDF